MFKVLEYVAIALGLIGIIFLSLFCISVVAGKKEKILKNIFRALIFLGAFGIYVVIAIKFKLPVF